MIMSETPNSNIVNLLKHGHVPINKLSNKGAVDVLKKVVEHQGWPVKASKKDKKTKKHE